ncbi:MAG: PsbP-related protein [Thermomicrobiales bacterium]
MAIDRRDRTGSTPITVIVCCVQVLVPLLMLAIPPALPVGAAETFSDPQNRFSFQIPDGWQQDLTASNPALVVQYLTTNPDGAFNVTATPLPDGITIDLVPQLVIARLQKDFSDFQQTSLGAASVAGEQGAELDYTATSSAGTVVATAQILVAHNGTLYLLTLASQPQDIGAIQTAGIPILLSWQWLS